jgi:very-short-patch-repair endonuclease
LAGRALTAASALSAARDLWLAEKRIETMRIPVAEVLRNPEGVLVGILAEAVAPLPLHHPAAPGGPPPPDKLGEDPS